MAEQFDVKPVEEANYYTPPPEYREKDRVKDPERTDWEFLADLGAFRDRIAREHKEG